MTTIAASVLPDMLQNLVDARLDTIDRMLLGRVNRQDRLAIVREVESQIFDLLQRSNSNPETLDRDDVLAVLARLDPPEAYLPDDSTGQPGTARISSPSRTLPTSAVDQSRLPLASGVLGLISMFLILLGIFGYFTAGFGSLVLAYVMVFGPTILAFVTSILAVVFAIRAKLRTAWALVGLVTGILSLIISIIGGIILVLIVS